MDRKIRIIRAKPLGEKTDKNPRDSKERRPRKTSETRRSRGEPRGEARGRGRGRGGPRTSSSSRKRVYKPRHNDENSVYVGNLSFRTTEMRLGRHFETYGDIKDVRIVEDDKERSRGFGYVEFEDATGVEKALQADGTDLDGRKVKVAKVQRRERKNRKNSEGETKKEWFLFLWLYF